MACQIWAWTLGRRLFGSQACLARIVGSDRAAAATRQHLSAAVAAGVDCYGCGRPLDACVREGQS